MENIEYPRRDNTHGNSMEEHDSLIKNTVINPE